MCYMVCHFTAGILWTPRDRGGVGKFGPNLRFRFLRAWGGGWTAGTLSRLGSHIVLALGRCTARCVALMGIAAHGVGCAAQGDGLGQRKTARRLGRAVLVAWVARVVLVDR